ncbi:MAG: MATE family efflux transporter [Deltaproteobacteria bacterium]|nr:MATE family efflux transporter [Deltaproteobacteria bacterium]
MRRWGQTNGYRDVLIIGLPLVVSMLSTTVMHFTDRVFLSNYSLDSIAAAMPAGIASFLFLSFFMGVASYLNAFVAQYTGSGAHHRVGASIWQGLYFSFGASVILASLYFVAGPLFDLGGHAPEVRQLEVAYFQILTLGSGLAVIGTSLSCFYSGRGLTKPLMVVHIIGAAINIPLDYALINGLWIFPELGIVGAGIATVTAFGVIALLFAFLVFTRKNNRKFSTWRNRTLDKALFGRLMKYGLPGGVHFFIDIFAFTFFVFMIGRLGKFELAASNIVFSINHLAFMPMFGLSIALGTLVGQAIGRGHPEDAVEATRSTIHITLFYMCLVALLFVLAPEWLLDFFRSRKTAAGDFAPIMGTGVILLRFVAVYTLVDGLAIIYSGAIKGAGDTRFVMWSMGACALVVMVLPVFIGIEYLGFGLYGAWVCITIYITIYALVMWLRFRQGKWKKMQVIEARPKSA